MFQILHAQTRISQVYFLDEPNEQILQAYLNYMIDVAVILGAIKDAAVEEAKELLDFEVNLSNVSNRNLMSIIIINKLISKFV